MVLAWLVLMCWHRRFSGFGHIVYKFGYKLFVTYAHPVNNLCIPLRIKGLDKEAEKDMTGRKRRSEGTEGRRVYKKRGKAPFY